MKKLILKLLFVCICINVLNGQSTFDRSFGAPGYDYIGNDVLQLEDCNYLVLGRNSADATIVQKVDEFGKLIWSKSYQLPSSTFHGKSMTQLSNGNIVIVGPGLTILSIDKDGNCLWSKKYNNFASTPTISLSSDSSGDLLIAGRTSNTLEPYITRLDQNGGFIWHKTYSTTVEKINDIIQTSSGKIAVVGQYNGSFNINGIYLLITDSNGNSLGDFSYSENTQRIEGSAIIESNGNLLVTGSTGDFTNNNMASFLIKFSQAGVILGNPNGKKYTSTTPARLIAKDLIENTNNSVTIVGSTDLETFMLRTDANFNFNGSNNYTIDHRNDDAKFINTFDGGRAIVCSRFGTPNLAHPYDYIRLIKTDANGGLNGCEVNTTYNQTNFNPITFSLSSTVSSIAYNPVDANIICNDIMLDEEITCVSGVPICNYTGVDLAETYSCKVDLTNDDSSNDRAFDQLLMPNGNRMITGISYSSGNHNIFLKELDFVGNLVRLNAYQIQGTITNIEIVYDEDANEFILFYDTNFGGSTDIYLLRVSATNLNPISKHGPLMSDEAASFSREYAIEILYEPPSLSYPSGSYVLLAHRQIPIIRKSYIITIDKSNFNYPIVEEMEINGSSDNIKAYDLIKNPFIFPNCGDVEYVIVGNYNNDAFISNYCSSGLYTTTFDIDNNPSTTDIAKKITVAGNSYFLAGETTSGTLGNINGNIWLADISFIISTPLPPSHQLNGTTIYDENSSKPETLIDLDYHGSYLYLTGKYNISPIGNDPKYNYISKLDLNRNIIWAKEYSDSYNQDYKEIADIKVENGAINSIGDLLYNPSFAPPATYDYDIYINKTDLDGTVTKIDCFNSITTFTPTVANPTINLYYGGTNSLNQNIVSSDVVAEVSLGFNKQCCSDSTIPTNSGNCLVFDRTLNSLASASSSVLNNINTQDFTFEARISGDEANQDTHPVIFSNRTGTTGALFGLHAAWPSSTGTFKLLMVQFGQQNYFLVDNGTYNQSLLDGDCHHVAITRAGNTLTFFIDGQIIGTRTVPSTVNLDLSSVVDLNIGYDLVNPNSFNGSMSDIRIWNTARSASDIQNNMLSKLNGTEPNLVANWFMDEGTGQALNDNSTNGNNAVLGNNPNIEGIDPIWDINCCQLSWGFCAPVIDLGNTTLPSGIIHAQEEVLSSGTIPAGTNVSLKAGQVIELKNGFNTDVNADLEVIIEDCTPGGN